MKFIVLFKNGIFQTTRSKLSAIAMAKQDEKRVFVYLNKYSSNLYSVKNGKIDESKNITKKQLNNTWKKVTATILD